LHDVIVVGARCAGAATAMLLARRGLDVLLVDRARFPSELPHGHFIHRGGPARLHRWGLLDRVLATRCSPITSFVEDLGDFALRGEDLVVEGVPAGLGPRRAALDAVLVEAAVEAGANLRESFPVHELAFEDGRVTGVRGGQDVVEQARLVIGADGRNSRVAKQARAPSYDEVPTLSCWYFSYWSGVPGDALELYMRDRRVIFAFPTTGELFAVFVSWPIDELDSLRGDPDRQLLQSVDAVPGLAERVHAGKREERIYGATSLPNYLRRPYGEGWALVGDAGCHKDPFLALGICDAFRDAELLADAVRATLSGDRPEAEALADYERRRNTATRPDYEKNLHLASGQPPPRELLETRARVRGDAGATRAYFLTSEGLDGRPGSDFTAPSSVSETSHRLG
jgi:flavin-dependent dehydrogenase